MYSTKYPEPFNHHTHKNLPYKEAPFLSQIFTIYLEHLTSVKNLCVDNFTNGSQITVSIAQK